MITLISGSVTCDEIEKDIIIPSLTSSLKKRSDNADVKFPPMQATPATPTTLGTPATPGTPSVPGVAYIVHHDNTVAYNHFKSSEERKLIIINPNVKTGNVNEAIEDRRTHNKKDRIVLVCGDNFFILSSSSLVIDEAYFQDQASAALWCSKSPLKYVCTGKVTKVGGKLLHYYSLRVDNAETKYLALMSDILSQGVNVLERTGTGTISLFGQTLRIDISKEFPLLTTKEINFEAVIGELLCFLNGDTNIAAFHARRVKFWDENSDGKVLQKLGLGDFDKGEMGPIYGFNWRSFGKEYTHRSKYREKYEERKQKISDILDKVKGIHPNDIEKISNVLNDWARPKDEFSVDQISELISEMKGNPHSRRFVLTAWDPRNIKECCLPPCHVMATFRIYGDTLNCMYVDGVDAASFARSRDEVPVRSNDMFLGAPYNIASYAALTYILADLVGLKPGILMATISDAHIYNNHKEQTREMLGRNQRPLPTLRILPSLKEKVFRKGSTVPDFSHVNMSDFSLTGYNPHPRIAADMAV